MKSLEWALIQYDGCPYTKKKFGHRYLYRGETVWTCREKAGIYKLRTEASGENNPVNTLILDF